MPKKRKNNFRKVNKRILILCEGAETEPNYFKAIKHDLHLKNKLKALRIEISDTRKTSPKQLVEEAKNYKETANSERNPYEEIWIVFDKDGYTKHPETFDQAQTNEFNVAFSSPSFELWYLLHFEFTGRPFENDKKVISYLNNKNYLPDYEKSDNVYLQICDKTQDAISNAQKIRKSCENDLMRGKKIYKLNPYTDVDVLVEKLINL